MPLFDRAVIGTNLTEFLDQVSVSAVPGLQYVAVHAGGTLLEYAGGWADIANARPMTCDTTLMAYSMTKTFTAAAILQLVQHAELGLEQQIDGLLPDCPYAGHGITIRQLLDHTSGIPNPIPLRWVHPAQDACAFDEHAALANVLRAHPTLAFEPGTRFAYSNIGYWLLGGIVQRVTGQAYPDYVRSRVLQPLGLSMREIDFVIPDSAHHANGYLAKYSLMNLVKGFITDRRLWGGYQGNWLRLKSHYVNGPSFGGLVGTARAFGRFLQDQLQTTSVLFATESRRLFESRQADRTGRTIPMTLGWHLGTARNGPYLFKQGGGGGFCSEMRLYPRALIGSVVMVNSTGFNASRFLNQVDRTHIFREPPSRL